MIDPHDNEFIIEFDYKKAIKENKKLIYDGIIDMDSVFKLYYNKRMVAYIIVGTDSNNILHPIAFVIFSKDNSVNLTKFIKGLLDIGNTYDNILCNAKFMIDKSKIESNAIDYLK